MHPYSSIFTIAKTWKQPKCPLTDEGIKKMWCIYSVEYYSAIKKNEIMLFAATWMDLEIIILSEIRERRILYDITYMYNLKLTEVPTVVQRDKWHLGNAGMQVSSLALHSGLRIQCWYSCGLGYDCSSDLIPGLGTPYCHEVAKKEKKKK
uniref:DUF1725 domain-containing protein n=6 Tax=Sus scrofa TaxID=9823 RepID=A0A8D0M5P9_PIG